MIKITLGEYNEREKNHQGKNDNTFCVQKNGKIR